MCVHCVVATMALATATDATDAATKMKEIRSILFQTFSFYDWNFYKNFILSLNLNKPFFFVCVIRKWPTHLFSASSSNNNNMQRKRHTQQ